MGALLSTTPALASMGGMALTFFGMCVVCDEHLVPAIEVFIEQFNMPEDVAGVTLIAFGAAADFVLKARADNMAGGDLVLVLAPKARPTEIIGAIGVSGGNVDQDAQCAKAGVDALAAK